MIFLFMELAKGITVIIFIVIIVDNQTSGISREGFSVHVYQFQVAITMTCNGRKAFANY